MEFKVDKVENSEAYIAIEIDAGRMEEAADQAYRKVIKQVNIPGFRKGKAPRFMLEAYYGKDILLNDTLEIVIPQAYEEAVKELDIKPIAQPEFEFPDEEQDETFKFVARVAVRPEVVLGQIEGLEVEIPLLEVTEAEIDWRLSEMQSRYAELEEKEDEAAQLGDTCTIDFEGFVDGEPFEGGKGEDYPLELGSGTFIPGFEDQLIGLKKGESKDVEVKFPDSYGAPELAGQDAVFKVAVKKVEGKKVRPLDDEFAQEVSQFDTLAELREDLKNTMEKNLEARRRELVKREVLKKVRENSEMIVPEAAVKAQVQRLLQQMEQSIASQGLSMQQYYELTNTSQDVMEDRMRPEAEMMIKNDFILEKIVEEKGITVSDEEVDKRIEEIAMEMQADPQNARQMLGDVLENIRFGLQMDKAVDFLVEKAIITDKAIPDPVVEKIELEKTEAEEPSKDEEEA